MSRYSFFFSLLAVLFSVTPSFGEPLTLPPDGNGVVRPLDHQGKVKSELTYKKGKLIRKKLFYPNGRLMRISVYRDGLLVVDKSYYENGAIKSVLDKKHGEIRFYYENGRLRSTARLNDKDIQDEYKSSYIFSK